MINLLLNLEPYVESRNVQIIKELEEFSQIIFIQKGKVCVGFDINRKKYYCLQFKDKCIIGAYGITWNQRAAFNYTSFSNVSGFFIRKRNWENILASQHEIVVVLKQNILMEYLSKIKMKVSLAKKKAIEEFQLRDDHEMINALANKNVIEQKVVDNGSNKGNHKD